MVAQVSLARQRLDFYCGAVLAAASLTVLAWIIPNWVPDAGSRGAVAPSFFPRLSAWVVLICALGLMAANWRSFLAPTRTEGPRILLELAGWTVVGSLVWLLLRYWGFVPAAIAGTAVGIALSGYRDRPLLAAGVAVLLPLTIAWLVRTIFAVNLP